MLTILWSVLVPTVAVALLSSEIADDRYDARRAYDETLKSIENLRISDAEIERHLTNRDDLAGFLKKYGNKYGVADPATVSPSWVREKALLNKQQAQTAIDRAEDPFHFLTHITLLNVLGFLAALIIPPVLVYAVALVLAWIAGGFKRDPHSP